MLTTNFSSGFDLNFRDLRVRQPTQCFRTLATATSAVCARKERQTRPRFLATRFAISRLSSPWSSTATKASGPLSRAPEQRRMSKPDSYKSLPSRQAHPSRIQREPSSASAMRMKRLCSMTAVAIDRTHLNEKMEEQQASTPDHR